MKLGADACARVRRGAIILQIGMQHDARTTQRQIEDNVLDLSSESAARLTAFLAGFCSFHFLSLAFLIPGLA
jgi:hypothetical protein